MPVQNATHGLVTTSGATSQPSGANVPSPHSRRADQPSNAVSTTCTPAASCKRSMRSSACSTASRPAQVIDVQPFTASPGV